MRRVGTFLVLFLVSVWAFGQTTPAGQDSASPGNQPQQRRRFSGVTGSIVTINPDSLTVKTMQGQTVQVNLNDKTQYRKDRQPAKLEDFKVGDEVMVRGEPAGENTWQAEMVAARPAGGFGGGAGFRDALGKRFIVGEVKAINGTQLTILRPDGVSQTITVDESTSFQKQGASITLADVKAGDHVFGRGELKNDVFVPAVLNVGDLPMGRGRGRGQAPAQGQGTPDSH